MDEAKGDRMKIYVAASFPRKSDALQLAFELMKQGYEVTSGWLEQEDKNANENVGEFKNHQDSRDKAMRDLKDIDNADALVMISGDNQSGGGRRFEAGYALAKKKIVFIFGPKEIIFDHLVNVRYARTFDDLIIQLAKIIGQMA